MYRSYASAAGIDIEYLWLWISEEGTGTFLMDAQGYNVQTDCHHRLGTSGPSGHIIFGSQNPYSGELLGRAFSCLDTINVGLVHHLGPFLLSCQASAGGVAGSGRDGFKACLQAQPLHLVDGDRV